MSLETAAIPVRRLAPKDLEGVIALDARITGRRREAYFQVKLAQALADTGIEVSLAVDQDGRLAGFLLARVWYGEFGEAEPVAVLDTIGVDPSQADKGIGRALLRQLRLNLQALGIQRLQTEVAWSNPRLLSFFHHQGFEPAPRFCLDLDLERARKLEEAREEGRQPL